MDNGRNALNGHPGVRVIVVCLLEGPSRLHLVRNHRVRHDGGFDAMLAREIDSQQRGQGRINE